MVHQGQDPVFTGYAWTGRLLSAGARLSYALHRPQDNPEMESFFGRFEVEKFGDAGTGGRQQFYRGRAARYPARFTSSTGEASQVV